jgi:very-short-patch-repair endonuclease
LRDEGWQVLRFWEKDIKKSIGECVKEVVAVLDRCGRK